MYLSQNKFRNSFTLIELLVVLALVAILSVVVVMTLNPAELLKQARDSNRLSDLSTINTALNLFSTDVTGGFMGTSTVVYVSIPDNASSTCGSLGLPTLPSGYVYNCVTTQNLRNTDGTGWIPVNFQRISSNSPISQLPIDPTNTTSTKYYTYVTGGSWKVIATPESQKYLATAGTDGGSNIGQFEVGNNMSLAPFMDGLVGWWKFDEGVGAVAADSSGHGNNASIVSGATWASGKIGGSLLFGGTNNVVTAACDSKYNFNPAQGQTLSVWVNQTSFECWSYFLNIPKTSPPYVQSALQQACSSGQARFYVADTPGVEAVVSSAVSLNQWHNLVGVWNSSFISLYVDGQMSGSAPSTLGSSTCGYGIGFATNALGNLTGFGGYLDDARIYNRALSAIEVLALYDSTK